MACHDVLPGDVRMFDAFSFQSWIFLTAVSSEISTRLDFRLVGHQLMSRKENVCDELSGALQVFEDITC